jgi:hypothetical protein
LKWLLLPALAVLTVQAAGQANVPKSDWELEQERRDWKESDVKLPAYPKAEGLIEFFVSGATSFRFFIDPASLSLELDGVVRYTLVARSPSGVSNVSFEGIRCATNSYKQFALGSDGRWAARQSEWRQIEPRFVQRWHNELRSQYFCPSGAAIQSAEEGLNALRRGGHPALRNR